MPHVISNRDFSKLTEAHAMEGLCMLRDKYGL